MINLESRRGRPRGSVPLDLLNVKLASELVHVSPRAAQPRPQRCVPLPVGRRLAAVRLLDGGVRRRRPGVALFGPRLNFLKTVFVQKRVVGVALGDAPEGGGGLARLADVFTCDSWTAEAVEIPKFLSEERQEA